MIINAIKSSLFSQRIKHFLTGTLCWAFVVIPSQDQKKWKELAFSSLPTNLVRWQDGKLEVDVRQSASPLIYKLPDSFSAEKKVSSFSLKARFKGTLPPAQASFPEDFPLRIGFVLRGDKRLAWWQRAAAANWVKELFKLAPPGVGLDKIHFFSLTSDPAFLGKSRVHPKSDLMFETIIGVVPAVSTEKELVNLKYDFIVPLEVVALWFSLDGDQTQSTFQVTIEELILNFKDHE